MKLPDFTEDRDLNALRRAMNAVLGKYVPAASVQTLTPEEIEALATEGIEIPIDQVQVLNDGTHFYKGRRVIVYIRDVAVYNDQYSMPRYHLAMCDTLARMIEQNRYSKRYVVSTREDGKFTVQKIRGRSVVKSDEPLDICQHCLDELGYKGFSLRDKTQKRRQAVEQFSIHLFFEEFGKSCVWAMPRYDSQTAPPNVYSAHFYRIASTIKAQRGYRCEAPNCRIDLSNTQFHRFLHAHHVNADKTDNHPSNIQLLCIRCHADSFQHSHLRESPDFAKFIDLFHEGGRSGRP